MEFSKQLQLRFFALFIGALLSSPSFCQKTSSDSTEFAFVPAIAYNSDNGFMFGGIVNLYAYKNEAHPFYSYTVISGILSTKGLANFSVLFDKPHAFGKDLRLISTVYGGRFFEDSFYGIGAYQKITAPPVDLPDYYLFKSFSLGFEVMGRFPLQKISTTKQLDATFMLDLVYETPWENGQDRLISQNPPLGFDGGRSFLIGMGLIWEGRDNEFLPTKGNYAAITLKGGHTLWASNFNMALLEYEVRQYVSFYLIRDITFATRLTSIHSFGDVPYWKMPYAGDDETLRGYVYRRFMDDNVTILNTELRTWLFEFPSAKTKIGGTLFVDSGRTYPTGNSLKSFTSDIKHTFGFGGLVSFFTPEFVIRGDVGFSEEGTGIYFQIGFMF